jgi:hypothetical protein
LVYIEPGMPEESKDEIGTSAEASKAAIDSGAEPADISGQRIAQVLLDVAMAPLLGIQIGGIGREPMHLDLRMRPHILFDHRSAVGVEPVPDNHEGAGDVALNVTEGDDPVVSADGMRDMSLVNATRHG